MCFASAEKVTELQELLNKKDQEMKVMEDRYKKYLEKAKSVSVMMESYYYLAFFAKQRDARAMAWVSVYVV